MAHNRAYDENMTERDTSRLQYAARAIPVLEAIARKKFGLTIDPETLGRWEDAMKVMRIVDSYADADEPSKQLQHLALVLETFDELYPRLSVDRLGGTRYARLIKNAAVIIRLGMSLREAPDVETYMSLRHSEGQRTAEALMMLATPETWAQRGYADKLVPLVGRLAVAAGYMDTAVDLKRDYAEGTISFKPTRKARMALFRGGSSELASALPEMMTPTLPLDFARLGITALWSHHVRNRTERNRES